LSHNARIELFEAHRATLQECNASVSVPDSWTCIRQLALGLESIVDGKANEISSATAEAAAALTRYLVSHQEAMSPPASPADVVRQFIDSTIEPAADGTLTEAECYAAFERYCTENSVARMPRSVFTKFADDVLGNLGSGRSNNIRRSNPSNGAVTQQRGWRRIKLRSAEEVSESLVPPVPTVPSCPTEENSPTPDDHFTI
jgi:hypothetical protein